EAAPAEELRIAFEAAYRGIYGYAPEGPLEVESLRVIVASPPAAEARPFARSAARAQALEPPAPRPVCFGGSWLPTTLHHRERLQADSRFAGPALVLEAHSTTLVPPGWSCRVDEAGALVLERAGRAG
nr:hydantoinase/oxoprolinase family protein [Thermoanaerobaculia bacterium]